MAICKYASMLMLLKACGKLPPTNFELVYITQIAMSFAGKTSSCGLGPLDRKETSASYSLHMSGLHAPAHLPPTPNHPRIVTCVLLNSKACNAKPEPLSFKG